MVEKKLLKDCPGRFGASYYTHRESGQIYLLCMLMIVPGQRNWNWLNSESAGQTIKEIENWNLPRKLQSVHLYIIVLICNTSCI